MGDKGANWGVEAKKVNSIVTADKSSQNDFENFFSIFKK